MQRLAPRGKIDLENALIIRPTCATMARFSLMMAMRPLIGRSLGSPTRVTEAAGLSTIRPSTRPLAGWAASVKGAVARKETTVSTSASIPVRVAAIVCSPTDLLV